MLSWQLCTLCCTYVLHPKIGSTHRYPGVFLSDVSDTESLIEQYGSIRASIVGTYPSFSNIFQITTCGNYTSRLPHLADVQLRLSELFLLSKQKVQQQMSSWMLELAAGTCFVIVASFNNRL